MSRSTRCRALAVAALVIVSACASSTTSSTTAATTAVVTTSVATTSVATTAANPTTTAASSSTTTAGVTAAGISAERCAANKKAGKITYLSGFDFAASASIIELVVAKSKGYFDKMCLDVELDASFSTANYKAVAAGAAQFASSGGFSELVDNATTDGSDLQAVAVDGKAGISVLLVKADAGITTLADLKGKTIGVLGKITPPVKAMLASAGLVENKDYTTVALDGFDIQAHLKQDIVGRPVYSSNEPGVLDRAGVKYTIFDPATSGIPGSFGVLFTSKKFIADHPSAAQDFVRAAMKGMADAVADPAGAVKLALQLIKANGNKNFLSDEGESFRWQVESKAVTDSTPKGQGIGLIDPTALAAEIAAYAKVGVFAKNPTSIDAYYDGSLIAGVYGPDGSVIWPAA